MESSTTASNERAPLPDWRRTLEIVKKLVIWGFFFAAIYLAREFFFLAFMTFLFSYMTISLVDGVMHRFWPGRDLPGVRKLITLGVFFLLPVILLVAGALVMPHLIAQAQHLIGWISHVNPEVEASRMLEEMMSRSEFEEEYGNPSDPRYKKALAAFQKTGEKYVKQYLDFPSLDAWVEGSFNKQFTDGLRSSIRATRLNEGVTSKEFEQWFVSVKYPELKAQAAKSAGKEPADGLVRFAQTASPQDTLQHVRHETKLQTALQNEWIADSIAKGMAAARSTPEYRAQFQASYETRRKQNPELIPYTFDQFITLQAARVHGQLAFSQAVEELHPFVLQRPSTQLQTDFEASMKHELFQKWWNTSSPAKFIRHEIESNTTDNVSGHMEGMLTSLLNIPLDITTALLLSFLICIDFPAMKRASQLVHESWLRDVYEEIVPALSKLARLVGTAMYAQGLIALCNALLVFFGLMLLGVEHAALLGVSVFVLCLIPTLGTIIAWVLIVIVALVQPGGGLALAGKASGVVLVVVILETFVFSPRILGRMMELHPVLIIAILPVAHSFFGIWGLLLAIPVSVYVINHVILRGGDEAESQ